MPVSFPLNLHESETVVLKATPVELSPYGEQKFKFDALAPIRLPHNHSKRFATNPMPT